jgi:hypothetical protein
MSKEFCARETFNKHQRGAKANLLRQTDRCVAGALLVKTAALTPPPLRRTLASTVPAGFDAAFAKVKALVADFRANEKFYLSPAYPEQEARRDFIDKFWLAPGWDVNQRPKRTPSSRKSRSSARNTVFRSGGPTTSFISRPISAT